MQETEVYTGSYIAGCLGYDGDSPELNSTIELYNLSPSTFGPFYKLGLATRGDLANA